MTGSSNLARAERSPLPRSTSGMTVEDALEVSGVDRAEFALLATTTFKQARSLEELATLIATTNRRGLDGMLRHVYFERFGGDSGEPSLHVGIDGLRAIAAHTGRYAGAQEARYSGAWDMPMDDRGKTQRVPEKATVVVWAIVQGRSCAFEGTAYMQESYPGTSGRGRMWRQRPRGMLSIAAERQALRRAFPAETSGIGDVDSGEEFSQTQTQPEPPRTTVEQAATRYREIYGDDDEPSVRGHVVGTAQTWITTESGHRVERSTGEVLDPGDMGEGGWAEAAAPEPETASEPDAEPEAAKKKKQPDVTMRSALGQRFAELVQEAARLEVEYDDLKLEFPAPYEQAVRHGEKLKQRIEAKKKRLVNPEPVDEPARLPLG